jgi:hypothetical protein
LSYETRESKLSLVVLDTLDFEDRSSYELIISASDADADSDVSSADVVVNNCMLRLTLNIVDLNDNAPRFERDVYEFYVAEDSEVEAVVGRVSAEDLDQGSNGFVKYRLVEFDEWASLEANGLVKQASKQNVSIFLIL